MIVSVFGTYWCRPRELKEKCKTCNELSKLYEPSVSTDDELAMIAIDWTLHCELLYGKKQLRCCMEKFNWKFHVDENNSMYLTKKDRTRSLWYAVLIINKSTWSYENRVSKHFVVFSNFPCLIAWHVFTVLFAYVVFFFFLLVLWLGICVEVDLDGITISPPPHPDFFSLSTILSLRQVTVIWNQRAPKAGFGAV